MFGISSEERAKIREVKNKFHTRSLVQVIQRLNYARFMSKMCYKTGIYLRSDFRKLRPISFITQAPGLKEQSGYSQPFELPTVNECL